jgi:hypothetical protein
VRFRRLFGFSIRDESSGAGGNAVTYYDDYDDFDDDPDAPLASDLEEGAPEDDVISCPSCGSDVYEDSERCPACGEWMIASRGSAGLHWVWGVAAVLALISFGLMSVL